MELEDHLLVAYSINKVNSLFKSIRVYILWICYIQYTLAMKLPLKKLKITLINVFSAISEIGNVLPYII
jgi:hypothetical protein